MTKHIEIKHKIQSINKRSTFESIVNDSMLSDVEKQMLKMYYVDRKSFDYISDELGYSKAGILKMHKRVLNKLSELL